MIEIVRYTAPWCGPCLLMNPVFDQISAERPDVNIRTIDIDEHPDMAKQAGIKSIPTIFFYKDGVFKNKQIGAASKGVIMSMINDIK